jgi:hypothetical protein
MSGEKSIYQLIDELQEKVKKQTMDAYQQGKKDAIECVILVLEDARSLFKEDVIIETLIKTFAMIKDQKETS